METLAQQSSLIPLLQPYPSFYLFSTVQCQCKRITAETFRQEDTASRFAIRGT